MKRLIFLIALLASSCDGNLDQRPYKQRLEEAEDLTCQVYLKTERATHEWLTCRTAFLAGIEWQEKGTLEIAKPKP